MTSHAQVFVDSVQLIAELVEGDQWHAAAVAAARDTDELQHVTSEGVCQEFLAHFSRADGEGRATAAGVIRALRTNERTIVVEHGSDLLAAALDLYDGEFRHTRLSYQDCISIQIMRDLEIDSILTADQEFAVAGVTPLLRRYA